MYEYRATLVRVIDGDSIILSVDLGFNITVKERFRLAGIDTPERGQAGWAEATAKLTALLAQGLTRIQTHKRDSFGRWLVTLWVDDININQKMIDDGFAVTYLK